MSKETTHLTTGEKWGLLWYMAFDQMEGKGTIQSDIYALGKLLYAVLTGKHPPPPSEYGR